MLCNYNLIVKHSLYRNNSKQITGLRGFPQFRAAKKTGPELKVGLNTCKDLLTVR